MAINFQFEGNQKAWDGFYSRFMTNYNGKGDARMSVNQYKPVMLELERLAGEFSTMTVENWDELQTTKPDRVNHARSVLMDCQTAGEVSLKRDTVVAILPDQYRAFVASIFR